MNSNGRDAETKACRYLQQQGYKIVARNWRCRFGEIDIIARDGGVLVFIEVKSRQDNGFGGPEAAVDPAKQRRIVLTAGAFIDKTVCDLPARFDVIALAGEEIRLIRDAF